MLRFGKFERRHKNHPAFFQMQGDFYGVVHLIFNQTILAMI
jgi:hypothetical protein